MGSIKLVAAGFVAWVLMVSAVHAATPAPTKATATSKPVAATSTAAKAVSVAATAKTPTAPATAPRGSATVELVDGAMVDGEVVTKYAGRLVVRSARNATSQSFALSEVHAVTVNGKREPINPRRALTAEEKETRAQVLWADHPPLDAGSPVPAYVRQVWPKAPLLVWAEPGKNGTKTTPSNWVGEKGERLSVFPDEFDALLPAADKEYEVYSTDSAAVEGKAFNNQLRHLTVERNAQWHASLVMAGNMWCKKGGRMSVMGPWIFATKADTNAFSRIESGATYNMGPSQLGPRDARTFPQFCHHFRMFMAPTASVECIGVFSCHDKFTVQSGTTIVSEDSVMTSGNRNSIWVAPGATLQLMSGASVIKWANMMSGRADLQVSGTLMIGTKERPITRDVVLALGGHQTADPHTGKRGFFNVSLVVEPTGRMEVHSADPAKARCVFTWRGNKGEPNAGTNIALDFQGKTLFDGVLFDTLHSPGIFINDLSVSKTWKHVFYGTANKGKPDELYAVVEAKAAPQKTSDDGD